MRPGKNRLRRRTDGRVPKACRQRAFALRRRLQAAQDASSRRRFPPSRSGWKRFSENTKKTLAFFNHLCYYIRALGRAWYAPVAQLDRVTGYEPVGRGFESLPAYQTRQIRTQGRLARHSALSGFFITHINTHIGQKQGRLRLEAALLRWKKLMKQSAMMCMPVSILSIPRGKTVTGHRWSRPDSGVS